MLDNDSQDEQDEYKINTVIAARRAFERSEEREADPRRRQAGREYESLGQKYCPCCRDKLSTVILLCNSGLMTVTAQIAIICTIFIATTGLNVAPDGLTAVFLLTCFAVSIFGLCGIIGPVRKTFSKKPLQGAARKSSSFCIVAYMLANLVVLVVFFVSLCVCLAFLTQSSPTQSSPTLDEIPPAVYTYLASYVNESEEWQTFQKVEECCGFTADDNTYNSETMPTECDDPDAGLPDCYAKLLEQLQDNLNLLSGIMGLLFLLQLMAACAACQLLCCAHKRNRFTEAADAAVKKLGIAMETAREEIKEDEVLLDSDYSSDTESDQDEETEDQSQTVADLEGGGNRDTELNRYGDDTDESDEGNSIRGMEYNITQRSSGPDSSEDDVDPHRGKPRRADPKHLRQLSHPRVQDQGHPSEPGSTDASTTRAITYGNEVEIVIGGTGLEDDDDETTPRSEFSV